MKLNDLRVTIYADGADLTGMKEEYKKGIVSGFTTNPSLMKKAGVTSYSTFSREALKLIPDLPISMEVFSDNFEEMEKEAKEIASWGENVYVKIPITNSQGESSIPLIKSLSEQGLNLNITAMFTLDQVKETVDVLSIGTKNIISMFCGRIADTGEDPEPMMIEAAKICKIKPNTQLLWASCREVFNIVQADRSGCDIITVTNDILEKMNLLGKDLNAFSLETVQQFSGDSKALGFSVFE